MPLTRHGTALFNTFGMVWLGIINIAFYFWPCFWPCFLTMFFDHDWPWLTMVDHGWPWLTMFLQKHGQFKFKPLLASHLVRQSPILRAEEYWREKYNFEFFKIWKFQRFIYLSPSRWRAFTRKGRKNLNSLEINGNLRLTMFIVQVAGIVRW